MITKNNSSMNSTAETIFMSNSDENIWELCRRREDAIAHENYQKKLIQDLTDENESLTNKNESLANENASLTNEISRLIKLLDDNGINH